MGILAQNDFIDDVPSRSGASTNLSSILRNDEVGFGEEAILLFVDDTDVFDEDRDRPRGANIFLNDGGEVTVSSTGSISFNPNGQFDDLNKGETRNTSFTYQVGSSSNNGFSFTGVDTATVTIEVIGINTSPNAVSDFFQTTEDNSINGNVLDNDSDSDGDSLNVLQINGSNDINQTITLSSGALVRLNSSGTFEYNPNNRFEFLQVGKNATDSFDYTVSDGDGGNDTATVSITISGINDDPIANDDDIETNENSTVSGNILTNDFDPDGDEIEVTIVTDAGTRWIIGEGEEFGGGVPLDSGAIFFLDNQGNYRYDPNGAFNSLNQGETTTDSFEYTIVDSEGNTSDAEIEVTIAGENTAQANNDQITTVENRTVSGNITTNDSNPQGDEIEVTIVTDAGTRWIIGEEFGGGIPLNSGAIFFLDNQGNYRYDPNGAFDFLSEGETATDSFEYTLTDSEGNTSNARIEVTITGENSSSTEAISNPLASSIGTRNDDSLFAGEGNDIIVGSDGNDTLNGGKGDDTLIGGSGEDTFVFQDDWGNDTITDFEADDTIDVSSSIDSTEEILGIDGILSQVGSDAVLDFGNDNTITLVETQVDSLSDSNFLFA